jgi:hypothetical protein
MALTRLFGPALGRTVIKNQLFLTAFLRFEVATATMYSDRRRPSLVSPVAIPSRARPNADPACRTGG